LAIKSLQESMKCKKKILLQKNLIFL